MTMLQYKRVEPGDLAEITELYKEFLNDGDGVDDHLRESLALPGFIGVKCVDGERMAGVFTARPGISFTYEKPELTREILGRWPGATIFTGDMLIVRPEYRREGVGSGLTKLLVREMRAAGIGYFLMEMWDKKNGEEPAGRMVKHVGTVAGRWVIPDFYKDLHLYGMTCPDCGPGRCTCGATVALVALGEQAGPNA